MLSTNPKRAAHLEYRKIVSRLILLVVSESYKRSSIIKEENAVIHKIPAGEFWIKYWSMYKEARQYILRREVDIISVDEPFSALIVGLLLKLKYGIPLNVQIFSTIFENSLNNSISMNIKSFIIRFLLRFSNSIRAMCNKHREMLAEMIPFNISRIYSCPPLCRITHFLNYKGDNKAKRDYNGKFPLLLSVGRLVPQKDFLTLFEAVRIVKCKFPDTLLLIVGGGRVERIFRTNVR